MHKTAQIRLNNRPGANQNLEKKNLKTDLAMKKTHTQKNPGWSSASVKE